MEDNFDEEAEEAELAREEFLEEHDLLEGDIMQDELGREYIEEVDHETGRKVKTYLPE